MCLYKEEWDKLLLCPTLETLCFAINENDVNIIISQSGHKLYCMQAYKNSDEAGIRMYINQVESLSAYKPITFEEFKKLYNKVKTELNDGFMSSHG